MDDLRDKIHDNLTTAIPLTFDAIDSFLKSRDLKINHKQFMGKDDSDKQSTAMLSIAAYLAKERLTLDGQVPLNRRARQHVYQAYNEETQTYNQCDASVIINTFTRFAQTRSNPDERLSIESQAGKLLAGWQEKEKSFALVQRNAAAFDVAKDYQSLVSVT